MRFTIIDSLGDAHEFDAVGAQGLGDAVAETRLRGVFTDKGLWLNPAHIVTIQKAMVQDG